MAGRKKRPDYQGTGWGGKREHTGPKKKPPEQLFPRKTITLSPEDLAHLQSIDSNVSAAVRELIRRDRLMPYSL